MNLEAFRSMENRCKKCDRLSQGFPPINPRKPIAPRMIKIRLPPEASEVCDRLASEGQLGEAIVALIQWAIVISGGELRDAIVSLIEQAIGEGLDTDQILKIWRD